MQRWIGRSRRWSSSAHSEKSLGRCSTIVFPNAEDGTTREDICRGAWHSADIHIACSGRACRRTILKDRKRQIRTCLAPGDAGNSGVLFGGISATASQFGAEPDQLDPGETMKGLPLDRSGIWSLLVKCAVGRGCYASVSLAKAAAPPILLMIE
jgi:hypothetical protein